MYVKSRLVSNECFLWPRVDLSGSFQSDNGYEKGIGEIQCHARGSTSTPSLIPSADMMNLLRRKVSPQYFTSLSYTNISSHPKTSVSDDDYFCQFLGIQHTNLRAEKATISVSFNVQSQPPDIPDISSHPTRIEHTHSLNTTQNDPDISILPQGSYVE
jgi:hypothetical protein